MSGGQYPVHEVVEVIEGRTIYKSGRTWIAVLRYRLMGREQVALYKWRRRGDSWKRSAKFIITKDMWGAIKEAVENMLK